MPTAIDNPLEQLLEELEDEDDDEIHGIHMECQQNELDMQLFCGEWSDPLHYFDGPVDVTCPECLEATHCPRCGRPLDEIHRYL